MLETNDLLPDWGVAVGEGVDRQLLRRALGPLCAAMAKDMPGQHFCVHLYGSRQRGDGRPNSDLDLAIELLYPDSDEPDMPWHDYGDHWRDVVESAVYRELGLKAHVVYYYGQPSAPDVHSKLKRGSEVIFTTNPELLSAFLAG